MLANPAAFYASIRATGVLGVSLSIKEVEGCEAIVAACEGWPAPWTAYALGTACHETAGTMQPIRERGSGDGPDADSWDDYLERYDTGRLARALGNTPGADGDGVLYAGRGYVQLTGRANYKKAGLELKLPLLSNPDLALRPDVAAQVMRLGMEEGWFTGKRQADYLPVAGLASRVQFVAARRIINGQDRAIDIADLALKFQTALSAGGWHQGRLS